MTIESKTSFADTPEGQGLCFPRCRSSTVDITVKEVSEETIKRLIEEITALRAEIKALKGIIKNMG
jgi:hypothetical protein